MTTLASDRLGELLAGRGGSGRFSSKRTAPADELRIEVRGVGPIALPVSTAQAEALCRISRPARYGHGERTLLDRHVRDTCEVPRSRVKIDRRRWNRSLSGVVDQLGSDLGMPEGCVLRAELHSMLVYAAGQFFVPHQDSEKADDMVGSLVVTLPGSFTGGELVVGHGPDQEVYRGSRTRLSCVAFYSDCRHEILPVRSGYRVVLTYNLIAGGDTISAAPAPRLVDAAAQCLGAHFTEPAPQPSWRRADPAKPPDRLVYLLDHE